MLAGGGGSKGEEDSINYSVPKEIRDKQSTGEAMYSPLRDARVMGNSRAPPQPGCPISPLNFGAEVIYTKYCRM